MVKRPLHWAWSTVWTLCFDACGCLSKRRPLRAVDAEACFWGPVTCPKDRNKAPCNVGWLSLTVLSCVWPQYRKVDVLCVKYMPTYWFVGADLKAWISRWASSDKDSEPGSSVYCIYFYLCGQGGLCHSRLMKSHGGGGGTQLLFSGSSLTVLGTCLQEHKWQCLVRAFAFRPPVPKEKGVLFWGPMFQHCFLFTIYLFAYYFSSALV